MIKIILPLLLLSCMVEYPHDCDRITDTFIFGDQVSLTCIRDGQKTTYRSYLPDGIEDAEISYKRMHKTVAERNAALSISCTETMFIQ